MPLVILDNGQVPTGIKLRKFNVPVKFMTRSALQQGRVRAYLVVEKLEVKNNHAAVSLRYDVEGLLADVSLAKTNGKWAITDQQVLEQ